MDSNFFGKILIFLLENPLRTSLMHEYVHNLECACTENLGLNKLQAELRELELIEFEQKIWRFG